MIKFYWNAFIKGGLYMDYALKESSTKFENILGTALKVPGVRVDREQFLLQTLGSKIKNENQDWSCYSWNTNR